MIVLLIILIARFGEPWKSSDHTRHCDQPKRVGRTQADAVLGGLFPLHALSNGADKRYFDLNLGAVTWVEAMIFALDEINNNTDLLKNFTLGFDIRDTCNEVSKALAASLDFVLDLPSVNTTKVYANSTGFKYQATEPQGSFCKCVNSTPLILAVIGGAASPISTNVATIFGVDRIPQISYSSTSALLSDKQVYPSFLRTIPSDLYQAKAIADLLQSFGWNYVSVIASDNAYGRSGMDALRLELKARGICIAVEAIFYPSLIKEKLHQIIDLLKRKPRASVVVLWCQRPNAIGFLQEATKHDLRNKTWIGTETWGDAYQIQELSQDTVAGMIGIVPRLETHKEFERHLALLNPQNSAHNPWMKEFWEGEFDCVWQTNKTLNFKSINSQVTKDRYHQYYTQSEPTLVSENVTILCPKVNGVPSTSRLPRNKYTNVMNAVYAVAHGIENLLKCTHGNGLLDDAKCPQVDPFIKPEELLIYIRNVSFSGKSGSQVMFTSDGDPVFGSYAIKNLQQNAETGKMEFVEIGLWSGSERKLSLFTNTPIQWNGGTAIPPNSTCEDICPPGKYVVNGSISCCWTCVPCIQGFVKPRRGHFPCVRCPDGYDSNGEGTFCIKLSEDYLHLASTWGVVIPVLSTLGIFMTCFLFAVFIKNRSTAVVKASNRELSFIHLASILAIFTLPLTKIGKPTVASCALSPFYFSITFTICTSIMLLKTDRLLRIFQSRSRLTESGSKLLTNKVQVTATTLYALLFLIIEKYNQMHTYNTRSSQNFHTPLFRLNTRESSVSFQGAKLFIYIILLALFYLICLKKTQKLLLQ